MIYSEAPTGSVDLNRIMLSQDAAGNPRRNTISELLNAGAPRLIGSFTTTGLLGTQSSFSRATFRTQHVCLNKANEIRVAWYGGNVNAVPPASEAGFNNPVEVKASIEVQGALIPLWFNGRRKTLLRPGQLLVSDPCGVYIGAGETFFVRLFMTRLKSDTYTTVSEAGLLTADQTNCYWNLFTPNAFGDASGTVSDNSTGVDPYAYDYTDSGTVAAGFAYGLRPYAILGKRYNATVPGIAIVGDSISRNTGDNSRYVTGQLVSKFDGFGWAQRGLGDNYPVVQNAIASEGLYHLVGANTKNFAQRFLSTRWADYVLLSLGNNDMSQAIGTIQANFNELVSRLTDAGLKVVACTVLPRTTSTDFWKTVANQTVSANKATNDAFNAFIRAKPANVFAVLDINPAVENGSGKWLAPEGALITGTTAAGSTTTVVNVSGTLTADTLAGKMLAIGSEARFITDNAAGSITVQTPFTGAPGTGVAFEVIDAYTADGIHPLVRGHVSLASLLSAAAPNLFPATT